MKTDQFPELEDFDLQPATYQSILSVYDKEGGCFGGQFLAEHDKPEEAIKFAKNKAKELADIFNSCTLVWEGQDIFGAIVTVETTVQQDGEDTYVGTLFSDKIYDYTEKEEVKNEKV